MIEEKKMSTFGLAFYNKRIEYDKEFIKPSSSISAVLTPEIEQSLKNNKNAWNNFLKLAPSHKKQLIGWLMSAKKEITKQKRLKEVIDLLKQNSKLGMK